MTPDTSSLVIGPVRSAPERRSSDGPARERRDADSPTHERCDADRGGDRAQTQIDFAVGAGVFLVALAFVVAFVPALFEPFAAAESASPVVSDRIAAATVDTLGVSAADGLHAPTEPGVLSPGCTVAFFTANTTLNGSLNCPFDASEDPATLFGHDGDVQVVVHELDGRAPRDDTELPGVDLVTEAGTFENVTLSRASADPLEATDDTTVSGRIVSLDGQQYRLTVRVW